MLVVLNLVHWADHGLVRILSGVLTRPALAQQVPALIEGEFQPLKLIPLLLGSQFAVLDPRPQFVLLVDEGSHLVEDLLFVHDTISLILWRDLNVMARRITS